MPNVWNQYLMVKTFKGIATFKFTGQLTQSQNVWNQYLMVKTFKGIATFKNTGQIARSQMFVTSI